MFQSAAAIRKFYTEAPQSLLRSVPVPKVSGKDKFEFVHVDPDQVVNHVLAKGQKVLML